MKLLLKNIRENYNKEEKQEEDNSVNFNKLFSYSNSDDQINKSKYYQK